MFKFFNSDSNMAMATPDFDEVKYTEVTRVQLNEYSVNKLQDGYDFSKQLKFGTHDDENAKEIAKNFLVNIDTDDVERFLDGEYLGMKLFKAYLRMIQSWQV